jgi:hypothetical protein
MSFGLAQAIPENTLVLLSTPWCDYCLVAEKHIQQHLGQGGSHKTENLRELINFVKLESTMDGDFNQHQQGVLLGLGLTQDNLQLGKVPKIIWIQDKKKICRELAGTEGLSDFLSQMDTESTKHCSTRPGRAGTGESTQQ